MSKVNLLDCTLRDGGYVINFQFSGRDTWHVAHSLENAGIRYIEVGHGLGLDASNAKYGVALEPDENYISAAREAAQTAQIGCFFIPGIGKVESIKSAHEAGLDFIRIGCNVQDIAECADYIDAACKAGLKVFLNLMKTYAVPLENIADSVRLCQNWPLEALYVVDSAGCMTPQDVSDYVKALGESTGHAIGFHGHNNLGLANGNSLVAATSGATYVDGSLGGMGRSAGNAQTEILAALLSKQGTLQDVDVFNLLDATEEWIRPLISYPQGRSSLEVVTGLSRFHSGHLPRFKRVLGKFDVELLRLIHAVSEIDCVDPSDSLIEDVARDMSRVADDSYE